MPYDKRYAEFVRELLDDLGELRIRAMFGGAGVYSGELLFALIFEDVLYLRADEVNQPTLEAAGARQFVFTSKAGAQTTMGYWSLPEAAADDPEEATALARQSLAAATRKAAAGPASRRKKATKA